MLPQTPWLHFRGLTSKEKRGKRRKQGKRRKTKGTERGKRKKREGNEVSQYTFLATPLKNRRGRATKRERTKNVNGRRGEGRASGGGCLLTPRGDGRPCVQRPIQGSGRVPTRITQMSRLMNLATETV